jgi:membrane protein YqaA with SNARE-associated domain
MSPRKGVLDWWSMVSKQIHVKVQRLVKALQKHADRPWYAPLIALLSALDNFLIVIPNDGILVSSAMLKPRRWFLFAVAITLGSTLGGLALAAFVELQGLPWVEATFPALVSSATWRWTDHFFDQYGLVVVFVVGLAPLAQQPAVILAALAGTPLGEFAVAICAGRFIKFTAMAYLGSHAPRVLGKLWGMKEELEEVGVKIK